MYCKLFINPLSSYRKIIISFAKQKTHFIPHSGFNRFYVSHKNNLSEEITKDQYIKWYTGVRHNVKVRKDGLSTAYYLLGMTIFMLGMGFSAVPLYEKFCKVTNYGGNLTVDLDYSYTKAKDLKRIADRELIILFNADKNARLQWNFKPLQNSIKVDMPIFFFVDPDFINDPNMVNVNVITLSYTFFEAKEGLNLPFMPKY